MSTSTYYPLEELKVDCKEYIDNPIYKYKLCTEYTTTKKYLVILKNDEKTKTNEERKVVDSLRAKYRANQLIVVKIILIDFDAVNNADPFNENKKIIDKLKHRPEHIKCDHIIYEVGKLVKADAFEDDINKVCAGGIHYFKSIDPAFYYRSHVPENYTGEWTQWHDNGVKYTIILYNNGRYKQTLNRWNIFGEDIN
jgi:hypothetical protein